MQQTLAKLSKLQIVSCLFLFVFCWNKTLNANISKTLSYLVLNLSIVIGEFCLTTVPLLCTRDQPISFFLKPIPIFSKKFHRYLASCRFSIGHRYWYRHSKICLPMYLPIL